MRVGQAVQGIHREPHTENVLVLTNYGFQGELRGLQGRTQMGQAVRQESWQEIESESLLLGKAVTTHRVPESWVVIRKDRR